MLVRNGTYAGTLDCKPSRPLGLSVPGWRMSRSPMFGPIQEVASETSTTSQRPRALADDVMADDLVEAKAAALRTIAELAEQRNDVDTASLDAIEVDHSVTPLRDRPAARRPSSRRTVGAGWGAWSGVYEQLLT